MYETSSDRLYSGQRELDRGLNRATVPIICFRQGARGCAQAPSSEAGLCFTRRELQAHAQAHSHMPHLEPWRLERLAAFGHIQH
eukprot:4573766-Prymnesium_polylepis.1